MTPDRIGHWTAILMPGGGTYRIRLSLPGLVGNRPLPERLLQLLRRAAAVMPGPGARRCSGRLQQAARPGAAAVAVLAGVLTG